MTGMKTLPPNFFVIGIVAMFVIGCGPRLDEGIRNSFQVIRKVESPDGKWTAVLFVGGGGATTSKATAISIWPSSQTIDLGSGRGVVFSQSGLVEHAELVWQNSHQLRVLGMPDSAMGEVYSQEKKWESVKIIYAGKAP